MLNLVQLIGNLGQDPEVVTFEGGSLVRLSLATSETYKDKSGKKVAKTQWHRLVVYGTGAEIIEKYCSKGDRLYVAGKIEYRSWEGNDGEKKYATDIKVRDFKFLSNKNDEVPTKKSGKAPVPAPPVEDDDFPF